MDNAYNVATALGILFQNKNSPTPEIVSLKLTSILMDIKQTSFSRQPSTCRNFVGKQNMNN